jgi:hypothetical protein
MDNRIKTVKMFPAKGIVSDEVVDFSKDPFFIKKAETAKKKVDRIGFPKEFIVNIKH